MIWTTADESPRRDLHPCPSPDLDAALPGVQMSGHPDWQNWALLVDQIRSGIPEGMEQLYQIFSKGIRFHLCRQLGSEELDDRVHDIFLIVVQAIRRGELREPERLMGFVRTVVRRQVAAQIDKAVHSRKERVDLDSTQRLCDEQQNPEEALILRQKIEVMEQALGSLSPRDREILTRFYLHEQPQEMICEEMGLSENQFRLLKSRAKIRFGELGKKKLVQKSLAFFVRATGTCGH
jgi:RNA polymerase sigma-70 factor, ECF subfamily